MSPHAQAQIDQFLTGDLRHNAGGGDLSAVPLVGPLAKTVHDWFEAASVGQRDIADAIVHTRGTQRQRSVQQ